MKKPSESRPRRLPKAPEPRLGIFWLVDGKLLIDSAPLSKCEEYGDHWNHPGSHINVWEQWVRIGKVPAPSEYEEFPRGRVICDDKADAFTLLADKCILKREDLIAAIKDELHLPKKTTMGTDPHYRCFHCLYGNRGE